MGAWGRGGSQAKCSLPTPIQPILCFCSGRRRGLTLPGCHGNSSELPGKQQLGSQVLGHSPQPCCKERPGCPPPAGSPALQQQPWPSNFHNGFQATNASLARTALPKEGEACRQAGSDTGAFTRSLGSRGHLAPRLHGPSSRTSRHSHNIERSYGPSPGVREGADRREVLNSGCLQLRHPSAEPHSRSCGLRDFSSSRKLAYNLELERLSAAAMFILQTQVVPYSTKANPPPPPIIFARN